MLITCLHGVSWKKFSILQFVKLYHRKNMHGKWHNALLTSLVVKTLLKKSEFNAKNLMSGPIAAADGQFSRIYEGILVPPDEYDWTCASSGPPESTTQTADRSVQPFLHSSRQKFPILYNGRPFPPNFPSHGDLDPIYLVIPFASLSPQSKWQWHHCQFSHFCTDDHLVSLYFTVDCPFPLKFPLPV